MRVTASIPRFALLGIAIGGLTALVCAPLARAEDQSAVLVVKLPADAQLEIGGYKTKQTGEVRKFESPPLAPGKKYSYQLKATWTVDGKEVVRETKVSVAPGQTEEVDVRQLPDKTTEKTPEKKPDKAAEKTPDKKPEKTVDKTPDKTPEKTPDKTPDKTPPAKPAPVVKLTVPEAVTVKVGGETPFKLTAQATKVEKPMQVTFTGMPPGVTIKALTLQPAADGSDVNGTALVLARSDVKPGTAPIKVNLTSAEVKTEAQFTLTIQEPSPPKPVTLTVQVPAEMELEAGEKKSIPIKVIREGFEGPVTVTFQGLPGSDKPLDVTIPSEKNEGSADIAIDKVARVGTVDVKVLGSSAKAKVEGLVKLTVKAPPKPATLALEVPASVESMPGGKKAIFVKVVRDGFEGPVKVKFEGLPEGGSLPELTIPADQGAGSVELVLGKEIKEGAYKVHVAGAGGTATAATTLELLVKEAPKVAAIQLNAPPVLNLQIGGFTKLLPVTVTRDGFEGPVTLQFQGLPAGVTIANATVPADKEKVYAETAVTDSADAGEMDITIVAVTEMAKVERTIKLKITKR